MNIQECIKWIKNPENKEEIFGIRFIKRSSGEIREMNCYYGNVRELAITPSRTRSDPEYNKLIIVWDIDKLGYRSIPIEGILEISLESNDFSWEKVTHDN